jgi:hypothetical protein
MKNLILPILVVVLVGVGVFFYFMNRQKPETKVLAIQTVLVPSPTATDTPTPKTTPSPTPKPKPTPSRTPAPTPPPTVTPQQINEFIDRFAGQYAIDPNVVRHVALCESGFKPSAKNSVYAGLFQFNSSTWKNIRIKMGEDPDPALRYNAEEAVQTASYEISLHNGRIWPNCMP